MIGPEIDISEEEGVAIGRGLLAVARCDGSMDPREKDLIEALLPVPLDGLPDIEPEELARSIRSEAAHLFLSSCLLVAFADGVFSDPERQLIDRFATALEVTAEELLHLAQSVKEYLLAPLSKLANTDKVVELSKKIGS